MTDQFRANPLFKSSKPRSRIIRSVRSLSIGNFTFHPFRFRFSQFKPNSLFLIYSPQRPASIVLSFPSSIPQPSHLLLRRLLFIDWHLKSFFIRLGCCRGLALFVFFAGSLEFYCAPLIAYQRVNSFQKKLGTSISCSKSSGSFLPIQSMTQRGHRIFSFFSCPASAGRRG